MAQEFTINSSAIETKINQLLPSQGGFGAGVDFSASTMVIPIIDLTETAEGSQVRQDLQTALSFDSIESFSVTNTTTNIIITTGYFRVFGAYTGLGSNTSSFTLNDGASDKKILEFGFVSGASGNLSFDFIVKLQAGDILKATSGSANASLLGATKQIADLAGNLNP